MGHRDVTKLFMDVPDQIPVSEHLVEEAVTRDGFLLIPFLDPLGAIEHRSEGRLRDPVRQTVAGFAQTIRSYFRSLENHP